MTKLYLALDFGGTKHTAAVVEAGNSTWRAHRRIFSPPNRDARCDVQTMVALGHEVLSGKQPAAIGVSFGGPVDFQAGKVRLSHHVPGWENIPLAQMLQDEFGAPVAVDNDANVAALGEWRFGAGQGHNSLFYITVSTGVGGGWILDGQPWRGWEGMAGEIGHMVVDPNGPSCLCGKRGCVERHASGPYIAQDARQFLQDSAAQLRPNHGQILWDLVKGNLDDITGQTISQAAAAGDSLSQELLDRAAWALGAGIGNTANLMNPQIFVLGGGVTKAGERFWDGIRSSARTIALPEVHFEVFPALLGDDAPLWGAVALAEISQSKAGRIVPC